MTDRAEIEQIVRNIYAARMRGDVEAIIGLCHHDIYFELVGENTVSPVPIRARGANEFRSVLASLVQNFTFDAYEIVTLVSEGTTTAVRGRVTVTSTATGATSVTELADFIEIRDGRIVSFVQFCDTALAAKLVTP